MTIPIAVNAEQLNVCVSCGLCLPHCPTFRVTGEEALSPRGRIDAMRTVVQGASSADSDFVDFMSTCVQCRGCEPACPSGVQYGSLISATRDSLADASATSPAPFRAALGVLRMPRLLAIGSVALAVAQRAGLVPQRLVSGRLPLRRGAAVAPTAVGAPDAWLFTGCVMDVWFRPVHRATATVLTALDVSFATPQQGGECCGALHAHAGLRSNAVEMARRVIASMPGDAPILVNSAGCGAHLKEYGHLLGTDGAARFSARVFDIHEWIAPQAARLRFVPSDQEVIVQDPCHLRHVQRAHLPVHDLLKRIVNVVELDDEGLCCGAGGAYSVQQPELATQIRERKIDAITRARIRHPEAVLVASANPGCAQHLEAVLAPDGVKTVHPIELIAGALS